MGEKFQLHVSGLNMLSKCGIQFEKRYILGKKLPPNAAITIGSGVDRSSAADLTAKKDTGTLLPTEQVLDTARDYVVNAWPEVVPSDADKDDGLDSAGAVVDVAVSLAELHHTIAAPKIKPTHIQRPWVLDIDGLPVQVAGTIDIQEGTASIRDTKTSKRSPAADVADTSLQLTTYALAVCQHDGAIPGKVALDYCVHTKTPKLVTIESTRTRADFPHLLERIYQAHRMIEAGLFMPAPIDAWWCSARWCGYHSTCKYAARPVTAAA